MTMTATIATSSAAASSTARAAHGASSATTFAASLRAAGAPTKADRLREAATQLVAEAFLVPVLSQMHDSPFAQSGPFAPGTAERRFTPMLDQQFADRVAGATRFDLVDAIVRRLESRGSSAVATVKREVIDVAA